MSKYVVSRLKKEPTAFLKRAFLKLFIDPFRYRAADGYDAEKYWHNRFSRYREDLKGSGVEGFNETENKKTYEALTRVLDEIMASQLIDLKTSTVLTVGCGTGFEADFFSSRGTKSFTGIDITNVLFSRLQQRFPRFTFLKKDITAEPLEGHFDIITMIDVIEHITTEEKLTRACEHIKRSLSANGILILYPAKESDKRHAFYFRSWSQEAITQRFTGYTITSTYVPLHEGYLLVIQPPRL